MPLPAQLQDFIAALTRHKQAIRSVSSGSHPAFIRWLSDIQVAHLTRLSVQNRIVDQALEDLVQQNRGTLQHLEIKHVVRQDLTSMPSLQGLYTKITHLDQLRHLQLSFIGAAPDIDHWLLLVLIHLPSSVQDLELSATGTIYFTHLYTFSEIMDPAPISVQMPAEFAENNADPDLSTLAFNFSSTETLSKITTVLSRGISRNIQSFSLQLPLNYDNHHGPLVACLDVLEVGPLKKLVLSETRLTSLWIALSRHLPYLESLALHNSTGSNVTEAESIFQDCPHLRHLTLDSDEYDRYVWNPWDLWGQVSWSFSRNLTHLSLLATCINSYYRFQNNHKQWSPDSSLLALYPKTIPQALHIYVNLARLTHLEFLQIGVVHDVPFELYEQRGSVPCDFSLKSGLDILAPLKRLRRLAFFERKIKFRETLSGPEGVTLGPSQSYIVRPMEAQIGPEEAEWMVQNWPCLKAIELNIKEAERSRQEALVYRASANQWKEALAKATEACALLGRARDAAHSAIGLSKLARAVKSDMIPKQKEAAKKAAAAEIETIATPAMAHAAWYASEAIRLDFVYEAERAKEEAFFAEKVHAETWGYKHLGPLSDWVAIREQLSGRVKVQLWPGEGEVNLDEVTRPK